MYCYQGVVAAFEVVNCNSVEVQCEVDFSSKHFIIKILNLLASVMQISYVSYDTAGLGSNYINRQHIWLPTLLKQGIFGYIYNNC